MYIATYLKYNTQEEIKNTDCYFIMPISMLLTSIFSGFGGVLEKKFGPKLYYYKIIKALFYQD